MNEDIIKEFGDFTSKMDYLLQEGVIFSEQEKDLLLEYDKQLHSIVYDLTRPRVHYKTN